MKPVLESPPGSTIEVGWFDRNRSSIVIMLASTAVALLKLAVGWHTGSLSVLADATLALAAGARSAYLVAFADAMEHDDDSRRRLARERISLAALFALGLLLVLTGWDLFGAAVVRLVEGSTANPVSVPVLAVLSGLTFIQLGFFVTARRFVPKPLIRKRVMRRWVAWTPAASTVALAALALREPLPWLDPAGAILLVLCLVGAVLVLVWEGIVTSVSLGQAR
ncbi:MAG: hypothetical protein OHK005_14320 [Candidatus Methylacidiphilales bacterium]